MSNEMRPASHLLLGEVKGSAIIRPPPGPGDTLRSLGVQPTTEGAWKRALLGRERAGVLLEERTRGPGHSSHSDTECA